ncbi:hypothetical protein P152DRAFT_468318 [Eremomyces bilateralis CBS 781.70]|uniref:CASTOR ACT domain-containing protein n=1 Tax=Eremomyces bilateralis CBS 781.70 TaxID=1392243 RepID=A0A6G1FVK2_9PEZI|nr:uncharacterized protein P152DRAFT_468318 [Eremomyces bilateralis CBS 781.70]KAF1809691.1 hypothetical protein P152DRAFT_468318 [Eremomyces bilateralis CBS 781.70]
MALDASITLMTASVQFLDTRLALVNIAPELYSNFLQPILQLLLYKSAPTPGDDAGHGAGRSRSALSWAYEYPFVNISVTPIECSIVCSREQAKALFHPVRDGLPESQRNKVEITDEDFVVIQVGGEGLEAGQRVLELTSPLAMAGISIFFITTYFSDYILVPIQSRQQVVQALEDRGFTFENDSSSYTHPSNPSHMRNLSSPTSSNPSPATSVNHQAPPGTPPPTSITELETRTFNLLTRHNIAPDAQTHLRLIQCAARREPPSSTVRSSRPASGFAGGSPRSIPTTTPTEMTLQNALTRALIGPPRFLSITLTTSESPSVLMEKILLPLFDLPDGESALLGSKEDILIPVTLDLRTLPLESTGIVCGVAGKLVGGMAGGRVMEGGPDPFGPGAVEMSYLSTARAGTVMVAEAELERAMGALGALAIGKTKR